jgi:hypothetical protein
MGQPQSGKDAMSEVLHRAKDEFFYGAMLACCMIYDGYGRNVRSAISGLLEILEETHAARFTH